MNQDDHRPDLLSGVTRFFRDKREYDVLETRVMPEIFRNKEAGQQVRVWVPGCATGEEAYSIGILLHEHIAKLECAPQVQIFATDIDGRALATARVGRYRTEIENDMSPERLARWFVREGDTYCVVKELREMCIFSQHNVIEDAPFSRLDLVSCRNLLIDLNADLQNRVIPLLYVALLPDRFLALGNMEDVMRHQKLFAPVDRRARIFRKLETATRLPPDFPISTAELPPVRGPTDIGLERRAQSVAERHAPTYVITDDDFQILHFSGRTDLYIEPTAGTTGLDLLGMVHRELRLALHSALRRALESNEVAQADTVELGRNGRPVLIDITVEPMQEKPGGPRNLVVIFKDGPLRAVHELDPPDGEPAHRVQAFTRATNGLKEFLESAQIATVFLDDEQRVMSFTPAVTRLLHLVESDLGRPIARIKARIPIEELYDDVRQVLRTLAGTERELTAPDAGTRYMVRILPYRGIEDVVAGVAITFIDVTAITRAEERQRLLLAELQHRVRNTLAVVRSIARRSAQSSGTVEEFAMHLDGRLNALARTQALVIGDPEGGVDLEYLVVEELLAYHAREGEQLHLAGPSIALQPKPAETIALAVHELATNAVKYGALSRPEGRVEVSWHVDRTGSPPLLIFDWTEKNGPPVQTPSRRGFGSELLEQTLAFELKARITLTFEPSGLRCRISVPLNQRLLKQALPLS